MRIEQYKPNRAGIRALLRSDATAAELMRKGQAVASRARTAAPVGSERGGHLKDHIIVNRADTKNRARAQVVANTPYARRLRSNYLVESLDGVAKDIKNMGPKLPKTRKPKESS